MVEANTGLLLWTKRMALKSDIADSTSRGCFFLFAAVFFAVWYAFLFVMNNTYQEAEQANHWPTVAGTILESRVQIRTSSSDTGTEFDPIIRYQYRVQRQQYVNDTWQKIGNSPTRHEAQEIVNRYPQGKRTTVYYDPADPQNSVLVPGNTSETSWVLWLFTYVPVGVVVFAFIVSIIKRISSR
jgi:hypothetical protein